MSEVVNPLDINEAALDREWLRQAQLSRAAGEREADARRVHDLAKAKLAVVHARLSLAARKNPGVFGLREKPNADEIDAAVIVHEEYQVVQNMLIEARHDLDLAAAYNVAMIDRRKALERLVELFALNYFSDQEPRASSDNIRDRVRDAERREARRQDD